MVQLLPFSLGNELPHKPFPQLGKHQISGKALAEFSQIPPQRMARHISAHHFPLPIHQKLLGNKLLVHIALIIVGRMKASLGDDAVPESISCDDFRNPLRVFYQFALNHFLNHFADAAAPFLEIFLCLCIAFDDRPKGDRVSFRARLLLPLLLDFLLETNVLAGHPGYIKDREPEPLRIRQFIRNEYTAQKKQVNFDPSLLNRRQRTPEALLKKLLLCAVIQTRIQH